MKAEHDPKKENPNAVRTIGVTKRRTVTRTNKNGVEYTVMEEYVEPVDYMHFDYLHHPSFHEGHKERKPLRFKKDD